MTGDQFNKYNILKPCKIQNPLFSLETFFVRPINNDSLWIKHLMSQSDGDTNHPTFPEPIHAALSPPHAF